MNEKGFSLLEALCALFILAALMLGIVPNFIVYTKLNTQNELRTGAVQAAQIVTESWRMVDPTTMPSSGSSAPQTIQVGDHSYDVVTSFCSAPSLCDADSRHLIVNVQQGGQDLYATETVYTNFR